MKHSLFGLLAALLLAGCAVERDSEFVRSLPIEGDTFDRVLHQEYMVLSDMEREEFDWDDTFHFNRKAMAAANGTDQGPDAVDSRALPATAVDGITAAYDDLMAVLSQGGAILVPEDAAVAQAYFDCWLQELEENLPNQFGHVDACRVTFEEAMVRAKIRVQTDLIALLPNDDGTTGAIVIRTKGGTRLLDVAGAATRVASPNQTPTEAEILNADQIKGFFGDALAALPVKPQVFLLYFLPGGSELGAASRAMIPDVLKEITSRDAYDIAVVGHTDRVADTGFNARLSKARAQTIKDLLVSLGVKGDAIQVTAHGESNPLVPTADGVPEPKNRRVEITVR